MKWKILFVFILMITTFINVKAQTDLKLVGRVTEVLSLKSKIDNKGNIKYYLQSNSKIQQHKIRLTHDRYPASTNSRNAKYEKVIIEVQ